MEKVNFSLLVILLFLNCSSRQSSPDHTGATVNAPSDIEILASGLEVPWGMDFLPDGRLLFNERPGRISILDLNTKKVTQLMTRDIWDRAEGGLLGLAVDPKFSDNHYVFIYETHESGNRIVRLKFENETLTEDKILVQEIPKKLFHDGGILRFGPDEYLYAGTGDAREPNSAQDLNSLSGKILRMDREGNIPADNPFQNYTWSYGHRNVQGICWDSKGNLYASEHGPSGELNGWCCHDELNAIEKGKNYGWPQVIGSDTKENMFAPLMHSGEDTWAPGGIACAQNDEVIMACLRGERLIRFQLDKYLDDKKSADLTTGNLYSGTYGRLRNVIIAPDGSLVFCSSNRDGRGDPLKEDDKIYRSSRQ